MKNISTNASNSCPRPLPQIFQTFRVASAGTRLRVLPGQNNHYRSYQEKHTAKRPIARHNSKMRNSRFKVSAAGSDQTPNWYAKPGKIHAIDPATVR